MATEAEYLPVLDVLPWTIGCVLAAIKMRCLDMLTFKRDISRPILILEIVACFGSLLFAGVQYARIAFQQPSLAAQANPGAILFAGIVVGAAAGLAVFVGIRQLFGGRPISKSLTTSIIASVVLFSVAMFACAGTTVATRDFILLSLLPIVGSIHLRAMGTFMGRP